MPPTLATARIDRKPSATELAREAYERNIPARLAHLKERFEPQRFAKVAAALLKRPDLLRPGEDEFLRDLAARNPKELSPKQSAWLGKIARRAIGRRR